MAFVLQEIISWCQDAAITATFIGLSPATAGDGNVAGLVCEV
jgi:hypothetical protein